MTILNLIILCTSCIGVTLVICATLTKVWLKEDPTLRTTLPYTIGAIVGTAITAFMIFRGG